MSPSSCTGRPFALSPCLSLVPATPSVCGAALLSYPMLTVGLSSWLLVLNIKEGFEYLLFLCEPKDQFASYQEG